MPNETQDIKLVPTSEVLRVGIKAPPFWRDKPTLWFKHIESQFVLSGISNEVTKYHHLVSKLECEELTLVQDILDSANAESYEKIKSRLISQYERNEGDRLKSLLQGIQLGDKKPSRMLCEMRNLAPGKLPDEVLKTLWLQGLPTNMQMVLSVRDESLTKLSELADVLSGVLQTPAEINQLTGKTENNNQNQIDKINARLSKLEQKLDKLIKDDKKKRGKDVREQIKSKPKLCFYHSKFGEKAHRCVPPCTYKKN